MGPREQPGGAVGALKMCLNLVQKSQKSRAWGVEIRKKGKNNLFLKQISVAVNGISR
jgi:hypothetical protein